MFIAAISITWLLVVYLIWRILKKQRKISLDDTELLVCIFVLMIALAAAFFI